MQTKKEIESKFKEKLEELKKVEEHRLKLIGQLQAMQEIINPKKEENTNVSN